MQVDICVVLKEAYEQQLREHETSMSNFLERIASLCDTQATSPDPTALAHAVRGLASQRARVEDCIKPVAAVKKSDKSTPLRLMKQPIGGVTGEEEGPFEATVPCLPASPREAHCCPAEVEDPEQMQELMDAIEDKEKIQQEFCVPRLPFIDAAGKVVEIDTSLFGRLCGPALKRLRSRSIFKTSCMQARTGCFADFVDGTPFKLLSALVIMLNYYYIVYQTDYKISHLGEEETSAMFVIELCFTGFYVWELCCQVLVFRKEFFLGHDMLWNLFDMAIVFVSVFELLVTLMGGQAINLSFLRILRFLKISRVLRMFSALRLMKEIRIMVDALAGSFLIFVFCCIMLAMFCSIFSIFFVQGATAYLQDTAVLDPNVVTNIAQDFGSVSSTMLALFMAITGGTDWGRYHLTIAAVGPMYNFLFLFFIAFSTVAFLNVVTGVFAEKAMSLALPSVDELMVRRTGKEKRDAKELVALLQKVSGDDTHLLTSESFEHLLDHPELVRYLEVRGLKPTSARRFFTLLLEIHGTSTVDYGTFVSACVKLDGSASSIDLHVLSAEVKSMQLQQKHLNHFMKEHVQKIENMEEQSQVRTTQTSGANGNWKCLADLDEDFFLKQFSGHQGDTINSVSTKVETTDSSGSSSSGACEGMWPSSAGQFFTAAQEEVSVHVAAETAFPRRLGEFQL